ncbi:MAG: biopolymer transporter ExbD [Myxococcales bacterium]|nr:biopolymer transporter ExbD [Myxococcales bacterium]
MTVARWQGWAGLAIAGVASIAGLITMRGDEDPADALRRYARERAQLKREAMTAAALDLPAPEPAAAGRALAVDVTATALRLDGDELSLAELTERARQAAADDATVEASITSSTDVPYARVIEVMDALRGAGIEKVALTAAP